MTKFALLICTILISTSVVLGQEEKKCSPWLGYVSIHFVNKFYFNINDM